MMCSQNWKAQEIFTAHAKKKKNTGKRKGHIYEMMEVLETRDGNQLDCQRSRLWKQSVCFVYYGQMVFDDARKYSPILSSRKVM